MDTEMKSHESEQTLMQRLSEARQALQKSARRGMSLVEVLIVLTIMASIAGVVGVYAVGALVEANIKEAKIEAGNLDRMVEQYVLMQSPPKAPETLAQLTEGKPPVAKKLPQDPWGGEYIYRKTGNREWEIVSAGPDGLEGTEDDIRAGK
jgi:general secretion pathway protein G